jgi:4-alpha-glucanotransferase
LEGTFEPEDPKLWIAHGEKILRMMLDSVSMLPIGEDLGVIPPEVRICLLKLGICGTKVMRWERDWHAPGQPYIPFDQYPKASMTTLSTHDSEQLELWWATHPEEAKVFAEMKGWDYTRDLSNERYRQILWDSHHTSSLLHINLLQEYLALFPELRSGNFEDERINVPGVISNRNWSCRYSSSVEHLVEHGGLKQLMRDLTR